VTALWADWGETARAARISITVPGMTTSPAPIEKAREGMDILGVLLKRSGKCMLVKLEIFVERVITCEAHKPDIYAVWPS
jgi:hypothetical protein